MRFIHTADWQIGKPFRQFGDREGILRQARLQAIETIGRLGEEQGASHVVVAGNVYDTEAPTRKTLLEPLERMRSFPDIKWHLLPGNHDRIAHGQAQASFSRSSHSVVCYTARSRDRGFRTASLSSL